MINYFSQTMNFLLNQKEVFLNSETSHLCLVWISTVLYSRACPLLNCRWERLVTIQLVGSFMRLDQELCVRNIFKC